VPWPQSDWGTFFDGDSFIVLHTKGGPSGLSWDVYFWLGRYTTLDEAGTAAYKTVELDDFLGGAPRQYREVQGEESPGFLGLFPQSTLKILAGGVDSGFTHVEASKGVLTTTLFHVSGPSMRTIRVEECPSPLSSASLCEADCFVLFPAGLGKSTYVFCGCNSSPGERMRASQYATQNTKGTSKVEVVTTADAPEEFWNALGGKGSVPEEVPQTAKKCEGSPVKLYHVTDASGAVSFDLVAEGASNVKDYPSLKSGDCYVLLDEKGAATVWVGSGANSIEKRESMRWTQSLLNMQGTPNARLSRIMEGDESADFKQRVRCGTTG